MRSHKRGGTPQERNQGAYEIPQKRRNPSGEESRSVKSDESKDTAVATAAKIRRVKSSGSKEEGEYTSSDSSSDEANDLEEKAVKDGGEEEAKGQMLAAATPGSPTAEDLPAAAPV